jgi:hypothetical protein
MGMFDSIICEYPLPDPEVQKELFQTKDLDSCMDTYTITKAGRLIHHFKEFEATPKEERPQDSFWPSIRVKAGSERYIDKNYHGWLNFYAALNHKWCEYNAKFTDGTLVELEKVARGF